MTGFGTGSKVAAGIFFGKHFQMKIFNDVNMRIAVLPCDAQTHLQSGAEATSCSAVFMAAGVALQKTNLVRSGRMHVRKMTGRSGMLRTVQTDAAVAMLTLSMSPTSGVPALSRLSGPMIAIVLSVLVHALMFYLMRQPASSLTITSSPALTVYLRSPPSETIAPQHLRRPSPSLPAIGKMPLPQRDKAPTSQPMPSELTLEKSIDVDGVFKQAGKIAGQIEQASVDAPVGQLRTRTLSGHHAETGLSRDVARAGRRDCIAPASLPGGLLAPLYLLMDKKGSGCKF